MPIGRRIRVLVIDDSAVVRKVLCHSLEGQNDIEVVGTAPDPVIAAGKIDELKPDVLTLDIEMPRMDGLTFLRKLMAARPMPVIVISSLGQAASAHAIEALSLGAVEVLAKPAGPYSVGDFQYSLAQKVRAAASARLRVARPSAETRPAETAPARGLPRPSIILLGASTGGTEALERVLVALPAEAPPIAVVQHIPPGFSKAFADRLGRLCRVKVAEAQDGQSLREGEVAIAPGDRHLKVRRSGGQARLWVGDGPPVCYQRPAVDVLFQSVAEQGAKGVVAALLTGMGSDGAEGLLQLRKAGAETIAQDEHSCVVFGMPKEAIRLGAAAEVLSLSRIVERLAKISAKTAAMPGISPKGTALGSRSLG